MPQAAVTRSDILAAAALIAGHVRVTPVSELPRGALGGDWVPVFKHEYLQASGSFKARGAFNALLSQVIGPAGVTAASGGNHGAAVALAAARLGHAARIFVPEISAAAKIAAIRRHGADVVVGGARFDDAQRACDTYAASSGALKIHPFGAAPTIAGQGTLAREWEEQSPVDTVLIAAGGGGLIAGACVWWGRAGLKIIGVEPDGSRALHDALRNGGPVDVAVESVAADSLGARNVGPVVYGLTVGIADRVVLVSDAAIMDAQRLLWRDHRIAAEPGGATSLAAVLSGAYVPGPGERVGILLCGANVDLDRLAALMP